MRSMTGFGVGTTPFAQGRVVVEMRSVNHRFTDVRLRLPREAEPLTAEVEQLARDVLGRGRFDVTVRIEGAVTGHVTLDRERARHALGELAALRDELAPGTPVPLSLLSLVPDLFQPASIEGAEAMRRALCEAFVAAARALDDMRLREGGALRRDLLDRLAAVRESLTVLDARAEHVLEAQRRRLRERLARLRAPLEMLVAEGRIQEGRLEQELAVMADRADVSEELTRLSSHADQLDGLLSPHEPDRDPQQDPRRDLRFIGRKLDFLLQEMAREANTLGAKSVDVEVSHRVIDMKTEIERMREQVQNVE